MAYGMSSVGGGAPDPLRKKKVPRQASDSGSPEEGPSGAESGTRQPAAGRDMTTTGSQAPQTFAQMQSAGMARPAPPTMRMAEPLDGGQGGFPGMVGQVLGYGGGPDPMPAEPPTPSPRPQAPSPIPRPAPPSAPPGPTPTNGGTTPLPPPSSGANGANGSPIDPALTQAILGWLGDPQKYSSQAFNADVEKAYGGIDDEYALNQKSLTDNLASRGLGSTGDSSIGLGRLSDLNVGRKSAKETVLGQLSSDRDKRFSTDLSNAVNAALGYNQQLYGHDYLGKQLNIQGLSTALQALLSSGGLDPALQDQVTAIIGMLGGGNG